MGCSDLCNFEAADFKYAVIFGYDVTLLYNIQTFSC